MSQGGFLTTSVRIRTLQNIIMKRGQKYVGYSYCLDFRCINECAGRI